MVNFLARDNSPVAHFPTKPDALRFGILPGRDDRQISGLCQRGLAAQMRHHFRRANGLGPLLAWVPQRQHRPDFFKRAHGQHLVETPRDTFGQPVAVGLDLNQRGGIRCDQRGGGFGLPGADAATGGAKNLPRALNAGGIAGVDAGAAFGVKLIDHLCKSLRGQQIVTLGANMCRCGWDWRKSARQGIQIKPGSANDNQPAGQGRDLR